MGLDIPRTASALLGLLPRDFPGVELDSSFELGSQFSSHAHWLSPS